MVGFYGVWALLKFYNGDKEGVWVGYDEDGTVWPMFTGTYKDGVKVSD